MGGEHIRVSFRAARERCPVEGGELKLLSVREVMQAWREGEELSAEGGERALCSNAALIARAFLREGKPLYPDGRAVLEVLGAEEIAALADRWAQFNRRENPSPLEGESLTRQRMQALAQEPYARLQWRVLRAFGALPTERRARDMTDRDYLWCALNLVLDREEELERLCPACRRQAEEQVCPVCGESAQSWGHNNGFDRARFEQLKGEGSHD